MYKKIILLILILIFIQGCMIEPIEDGGLIENDDPIIPEPPADPNEPKTDKPDLPEEPINPPKKTPKPPKEPYVPPVFPTPDPEPIEDEPPEDNSFCKKIIDTENNNINLGCEDNSGKYYDQCLSNQPINYKCEQNKCIKQEINPCDECSICTYKEEKHHEKLAPQRTYYCKENEFSKFPGQLTCECTDLEGQRYITGPTYEVQDLFYNDLVNEYCQGNWDNVCRAWTFNYGCISDDLDTDCAGGTSCDCFYGLSFHVTCKATAPDFTPDLTCEQCPDNFEEYCIDNPPEDDFICDFCMENC